VIGELKPIYDQKRIVEAKIRPYRLYKDPEDDLDYLEGDF